MAEPQDHVKDIEQFKTDLDATFEKLKKTGALATPKYASSAYDVVNDFHKTKNYEILTGNAQQHSSKAAQSEEVLEDDASNKEASIGNSLKKKHNDAAKEIIVLYGKQRTLCSKDMYDITQTTKELQETIANVETIEAVKVACTTELQKQQDELKAVRDRYCVFENQVDELKKELVQDTNDASLTFVPVDCRDTHPLDPDNGKAITLEAKYINSKIHTIIEGFGKYYKNDYNPPAPGAGAKRKGREPKFAKGLKVEVQWGSGVRRGWYPAQVADNEGGYTINYLDENGKIEDTEKNVLVTRIRKPKNKRQRKDA